MKTIANISHFFEYELSSTLKDILITRDEKGTLYLFNEYRIVRKSKNVFVVYGKNIIEEFMSIKNALAFAILKYNKNYTVAERIKFLDISLCSIDLDVEIHRNMLKNKTSDDEKLLYSIKLSEDLNKKRAILKEIKNHINSSIELQTKKFTRKNVNYFRK